MSTPLLTLIFLTRDKSLGWMVTCLAWIAHKFMSSMSLTNQASMASWMANNTVGWKWRSTLKSCVTSLTSLATHNFLHNNSVLLWYLLICWSATVPGQYLRGFLMAPVNVLTLAPRLLFKWLGGQLLPWSLSHTFSVLDQNPWPFSYSFHNHHQMMVISWQPLPIVK